jgi:hypothetical protein
LRRAYRSHGVLLAILLLASFVVAYAWIGERSHNGIRSPYYSYLVGAYDTSVEFMPWLVVVAAVCGLVVLGTQAWLVARGRLRAAWLNAVPPVILIAVVLAWFGRMLTLGVVGANFIFLAIPMVVIATAICLSWLAAVIAVCLRRDRPAEAEPAGQIERNPGPYLLAAVLAGVALVGVTTTAIVVLVRPSSVADSGCPSPAWAYGSVDQVTRSLGRAGATNLTVEQADCDHSDTSVIRAHVAHASATARLETDGWTLNGTVDGAMTREISDVDTTIRVRPGATPDTVVIQITPTRG